MRNPKKICGSVMWLLLFFCVKLTVCAQTVTIESLTKKIEANPKLAVNYKQRGDFYSDLANDGEFPQNLLHHARAVADYSAYLRLKPNDAQVLRMRALARGNLFIERNPFAASDISRAFQLNSNDLEARDEILVHQSAYAKFYRSAECREARSPNGFQGHAADEPLTALAAALDSEITDDQTVALKFLACGANPNYVYPKSGTPEFSDFSFYRIEHLIALLEAGADVNKTDRNGNTPLMNSLNGIIQREESIDAAMIERFEIALDYGARPTARNRAGQSVLSLARKIKSAALIELLRQRGAK